MFSIYQSLNDLDLGVVCRNFFLMINVFYAFAVWSCTGAKLNHRGN